MPVSCDSRVAQEKYIYKWSLSILSVYRKCFTGNFGMYILPQTYFSTKQHICGYSFGFFHEGQALHECGADLLNSYNKFKLNCRNCKFGTKWDRKRRIMHTLAVLTYAGGYTRPSRASACRKSKYRRLPNGAASATLANKPWAASCNSINGHGDIAAAVFIISQAVTLQLLTFSAWVLLTAKIKFAVLAALVGPLIANSSVDQTR